MDKHLKTEHEVFTESNDARLRHDMKFADAKHL